MGVNNAPVTSFSKDGRHELKFFKSSHRYYLDKKPVKSNTGVGEGYPKGDVLGGWKTGQGSIYAIRMANKYKRTTGKFLFTFSDNGKKVIEDSKLAYTKKTKKAAAVGTTIHDYAYALQSGQSKLLTQAIKSINNHKRKDGALRARRAVDAWWKRHTDEIVLSEKICASIKLNVAGTFDAVIKRNGKFGIRDYKTSKRIYVDHFQQCAGYGILVPEWFDIGPIEFFEIVHFSKEDGSLTIGLMDDKGYWLNGKLIIDDPNIMKKMTDQFLNNLRTVRFMSEFKNFWKVANG